MYPYECNYLPCSFRIWMHFWWTLVFNLVHERNVIMDNNSVLNITLVNVQLNTYQKKSFVKGYLKFRAWLKYCSLVHPSGINTVLQIHCHTFIVMFFNLNWNVPKEGLFSQISLVWAWKRSLISLLQRKILCNSK